MIFLAFLVLGVAVSAWALEKALYAKRPLIDPKRARTACWATAVVLILLPQMMLWRIA